MLSLRFLASAISSLYTLNFFSSSLALRSRSHVARSCSIFRLSSSCALFSSSSARRARSAWRNRAFSSRCFLIRMTYPRGTWSESSFSVEAKCTACFCAGADGGGRGADCETERAPSGGCDGELDGDDDDDEEFEAGEEAALRGRLGRDGDSSEALCSILKGEGMTVAAMPK